MTNKSEIKLTKSQKEAIAEQLANFFFDFWQNKQSNPSNRRNKAVAVGSGLLRNYPKKPKATT